MPDNTTLPEPRRIPLADHVSEEERARTKVPPMTDTEMRLLAQQAVMDIAYLTDGPPGIRAFDPVLKTVVPKMKREFVMDIGGVWELYAKAPPHLNEMPQFTSMHLVSVSDMARVKDYMREVAAELGHPPLPPTTPES